MPDDSTFFSPANDPASKDVNMSDVLSLSKDEAKNLIHSSEAGWSEIWLIDKNGRFRALKSLKPSFRGQARYESLLRKEYEIGYSLSHTAIREIYDFRNIPGLGNCIEMEWVDGVTLTEFLSGGRPARATAKKIALQLCDALSYLHSKQIVHRDLKPSNILITHNGNYLKLIDFGLSDASSWSILKGPAGTASFAAPELLAGGVIDNRTETVSLTTDQIARVCHRRMGVGADGLILLGRAGGEYDFAMHYYNSDGQPADMCGNGGRCIAAFACDLGLGNNAADHPQVRFLAEDGPHHAEIISWNQSDGIGIVTVGMKDVPSAQIVRCLDGWLLDTGVPHYVQRVSNLANFDVVGEGRRIRHLKELGPNGANVNFIEDLDNGRLLVRTYERGVEDETFACGTGVTACAIVTGNRLLYTRGGDFKVDFEPTGNAFTNVRLTGPVSLNFKGEFTLNS